MQWIAMISMLIDHIGAVWYPYEPAFRIIGRLAFPLYVYLMVKGYQRTRNLNNYFFRLIILAVISQIPYQLAFDTTTINVIGTLLISLLTIRGLDKYHSKHVVQACILIASLITLEWFTFDYGAYGLLLMLIYRYSKPSLMVMLHALLDIASIFWFGWYLQMASLLVTITIVYSPQFFTALDKYRVPNWLWRSFYPSHLVIISIFLLF